MYLFIDIIIYQHLPNGLELVFRQNVQVHFGLRQSPAALHIVQLVLQSARCWVMIGLSSAKKGVIYVWRLHLEPVWV